MSTYQVLNIVKKASLLEDYSKENLLPCFLASFWKKVNKILL